MSHAGETAAAQAGSGVSLRRAVKAAVFGVAWLCVLPLIVISWLEKNLIRSEVLFVSASQLLAIVPSPIGSFMRAAFYSCTLNRCSWEVHIGFGSLFTHRGAALGARVSTGAYCVIGHADIGDDVMMASRVSIPSGKRQHLDDEGNLAPVLRFDRVAIGSECWVGEGAIILADVGPRAIVSAGALVIKTMPGGCLIGGNPARVLKELGSPSAAPAAE